MMEGCEEVESCEEFLSCDSTQGGDASEEHYPVEFLNSIETGGLPPHKLLLCKCTVLMVIRNYAPFLGVCNGTRVMVLEKRRRLLKVLILTGPKQGNEVTLPRICCDSAEDTDLPFCSAQVPIPSEARVGHGHQHKPRQNRWRKNRHLLEQAGLCSWAVVLCVVQSYAG